MTKNILIKGLSKSIKNIKDNMNNDRILIKKIKNKYQTLKCLSEYDGE